MKNTLMNKFISFLDGQFISEGGEGKKTYTTKEVCGTDSCNGHIFPALRKLGYAIKVTKFAPHTYKAKKTGKEVTAEKWFNLEFEADFAAFKVAEKAEAAA